MEVKDLPGGMKLIDGVKVAREGYVIPHVELTSIKTSKKGKNTYFLSLDNRFGFTIKGDENFNQAMNLLAKGMAIACGLSNFGKHCRPMGELAKFNEYIFEDADDPDEKNLTEPDPNKWYSVYWREGKQFLKPIEPDFNNYILRKIKLQMNSNIVDLT